MRMCAHMLTFDTPLLIISETPFGNSGRQMSKLTPALVSPESWTSPPASGHRRLGKKIWPDVGHELDEKL